MATNFNEEIENLLSNLGVPFSFMYYEGNADTYITYMQTDIDNSYAAEDQIAGYVVYYDFDIYSKGNYFSLRDKLIAIMQGAGWSYQPSRESPDQYERDTKFFHKTICFAHEREV